MQLKLFQVEETPQSAFDNVEFDNAGFADITTNDRFDILRAGKYQINGFATLGVSDGILVQSKVYINGSIVKTDNVKPGGSSNTTTHVNISLDLAVSDYVELYLNHLEGSDEDTSTTIQQKPELSISEIR